MLRIGLVCPELHGHLNPLTSLGCELRRRGHQVGLFGGVLACKLAWRHQLDFTPLGEKDELAAKLERCWADLGAMKGFSSMRQTGKGLNLSARMLLRDLPSALDAYPVDGLILDQLSPAALPAAEARSLPFVIACNALALHYGPSVPPPPLPWTYRDGPLGRIRNRLAWHTLVPLYDLLAGSKSVGVKPQQLVFNVNPGLARISQQPAFFEFPYQAHPEHFHFTAPWHSEGRDADIEFPWDRLDDRPLIYASMGSLQNNQRRVFANIARAMQGMPVQVVLSRGGAAQEIDLRAPDNVMVVSNAPQLRLLDRAALAITHAGLNTAMECIARAVPMVCLPVTNDQPGVAKRVEWLGCGEVLSVARASARRIRRLVDRVLGDDGFAKRAKEIRNQLPERSGVELAADIVEEAFRTGRRVLSPVANPSPGRPEANESM
ncbi:MAG: glycosyltransferase [Phycisphaerales bacterium]|nr:glycosyltransferase [Phycisphaerales bacterium]